jgi:chromosomal replication initiation ATPase DnaA
MSRVDHWADVRDRSYALVPPPELEPELPEPEPSASIASLNAAIQERDSIILKQSVTILRLNALIEDREKIDPPFKGRRIATDIAQIYGLTLRQLCTKRRHKKLSHARQHAMFAVYDGTTLGLTQISKLFGGFDHTTVLHGIRAHAKRTGIASPIPADLEDNDDG